MFYSQHWRKKPRQSQSAAEMSDNFCCSSANFLSVNPPLSVDRDRRLPSPAMIDPEITPEIIHTIDILEALENLLDIAPNEKIEQILEEAWLQISETFPEDFKEATREDAGSEGLRLYIRVKAFFGNPSENPITKEDLETYYLNHTENADDTDDTDDADDAFAKN